ncbi:MAG: hypothetical protein ABSB12_03570 [Candidatus Saccharimonadales bacterium]
MVLEEERFQKWPLDVVASIMYGRIMGNVQYTDIHRFLNFMTSHDLKQRQLPTAMKMAQRWLEREFPILNAATHQWAVRDDDHGHAIVTELRNEFKDDLNVYAPRQAIDEEIAFSTYYQTNDWKNHLKPFEEAVDAEKEPDDGWPDGIPPID